MKRNRNIQNYRNNDLDKIKDLMKQVLVSMPLTPNLTKEEFVQLAGEAFDSRAYDEYSG